MPYILPKSRINIDKCLKDLVSTPGALNYAITKLCHYYVENFGRNYRILNEVIGVLQCAMLELYRQVAAPYEDQKKLENGPVSELDTDIEDLLQNNDS